MDSLQEHLIRTHNVSTDAMRTILATLVTNAKPTPATSTPATPTHATTPTPATTPFLQRRLDHQQDKYTVPTAEEDALCLVNHTPANSLVSDQISKKTPDEDVNMIDLSTEKQNDGWFISECILQNRLLIINSTFVIIYILSYIKHR